MPNEVEIDWTGFDPVEVPEPPPADALAAQLDAEAVDELAAKPADYDVGAFPVRERNTYDCRDKLKAMGCRWIAEPVKAWVAKDRAMYESAVDLCRVADGRPPLFANPPGTRQKLIGETLAEKIEEMRRAKFETKPASHERRTGIPNGGSTDMSDAIANSWTDEMLVAETIRRGFTVAKLGTLEPLAELLGSQDDEEDPFEKILEALK